MHTRQVLYLQWNSIYVCFNSFLFESELTVSGFSFTQQSTVLNFVILLLQSLKWLGLYASTIRPSSNKFLRVGKEHFSCAVPYPEKQPSSCSLMPS